MKPAMRKENDAARQGLKSGTGNLLTLHGGTEPPSESCLFTRRSASGHRERGAHDVCSRCSQWCSSDARAFQPDLYGIFTISSGTSSRTHRSAQGRG